MQQVAKGVFQLKVPIPKQTNTPEGNLEYTLVYLIKERDGCVLVDAGWNHDTSWDALLHQLGEVDVRIGDVRTLVVTHFHPDHLGLAHRVKEHSSAQVVMHKADAAHGHDRRGAAESDSDNPTQAWVMRHGMPADEADIFANSHRRSRAYWSEAPKVHVDLRLTQRETKLAGSESLYALWTPGHTAGHLCVYDPGRRLLFSGDHVLPTISPHVGLYPMGGGNPLKDFLESLRWVGELEVDLVLPPHKQEFRGLKKRIEELREHHQERLHEITTALQKQPMTAYMVSGYMTWNIKRPWSVMSPHTRFMAMTETLAHLRLLAERGEVRENEGERILYELAA